MLIILVLLALAAVGYTQRTRLALLWEKVKTNVPSPTPSTPTASPDAAVAAASDLADMTLWFDQQPWISALRKSMPRGVTVSMHAEPYDAEGWSSVELREHHSPSSGFDPNVSPMVGLFRVARGTNIIEWMEPVSGDYQPLAGFLQQRRLSTTPAPKAAPLLQAVAGDFETPPPELPNRDPAIVVPDPTDKRNHVARIIGPDEMSFTLPAVVPPGTKELMVKLRLLHPLESKITVFPDGSKPEGIRLRVRLLNDIGNSTIRDAVVRPSGQWRELDFVFYELPKTVVQVSIEALWMEGPVYIDDVLITKP